MKPGFCILLMVFLFSIVMAGNEQEKLEPGDGAVLTDMKMLDVSGEKVSINDVKKENGVLVLFSCNGCPFVHGWESRYPGIKEWADKNGVGMIVLNSNHRNRDAGDSYEAMQKRAEEKRYNFYYVVDEESKIANAFGGQVTPHAFLFNGNMELVYKGAIDDSYESPDGVKEAYLKNAIGSLASNESIAVSETKPVGCGIKRKLD